MIDNYYVIGLIAVMAVATMITRFAPFMFFQNREVRWLRIIGADLPLMVMPILVVYCLRNVNYLEMPHGSYEVAAIAVVALFHLWKRQTLLSIATGTALYVWLVNGGLARL